MSQRPFPVADLHCDLLAYLASVRDADATRRSAIGCSLPHLREGHVRFQVLAVYTGTAQGSTSFAARQAASYRRLVAEHGDSVAPVSNSQETANRLHNGAIGVAVAVENASGFAEEDEPMARCLARFDMLEEQIGPVLYLSLTHHGENRFGGGNTTSVGLTDDGRRLLDHLHGRRIAVDLSHASDPLAYDILDHIETRGLRLPIIASHSNFRAVFSSARNLPDDLAREIASRGGLIGLNFLRAYLHPDDPDSLLRHVQHALQLGLEKALCFGADFFATASHPDPSRAPFFFPEHRDAGKYQGILQQFQRLTDEETVAAIASGNVLRYLKTRWPQ